MGVKVHVADQEPIGHAVRRWKKWVQYHRRFEKWHQVLRWRGEFVLRGEIRRAKEYKRRQQTRLYNALALMR
jgi:ribosomal protein S21